MVSEDIFYLVGYIKISSNRTKTLKSIENTFKMPSEIARENNLGKNQVSNALAGLKSKNLAVCLNERASKGRLYQITPLGLEVLSYLK